MKLTRKKMGEGDYFFFNDKKEMVGSANQFAHELTGKQVWRASTSVGNELFFKDCHTLAESIEAISAYLEAKATVTPE